MTDTQVNIPLLRKAVEWAEAGAAKPFAIREWEQAYYVVPPTGDDPLVRHSSGTPAAWVEDARQGKSEACGTCYCIAGYVASLSGREWAYNSAHSLAEASLGLDSGQSARLFSQGNTIADVRRIAEDIAGERL